MCSFFLKGLLLYIVNIFFEKETLYCRHYYGSFGEVFGLMCKKYEKNLVA